VLLAGDGGVGKTTLLDAYRLGRFFEHKMTIGLSIASCVVGLPDGAKAKLIVYDLSGQPRFVQLLKITPGVLRGADAAILVFDLSEAKTLGVAKEWAELIRQKNGKIPMVLVGAKADLEPEVLDGEAEEAAKEMEAMAYVKTSAKLLLNVSEPFKLVAEALASRTRSL